MTTTAAFSLLAVTFGWVPTDRSAAEDAAVSSGYEYLVKLSAEDLEALRDGRAVELTSELPKEIGPIDRVRFYVGEGAAPRRLTKRDANSPKRIALTNQGPVRHTVAKPEVPEWRDAAETAAYEGPQKRTAYQNRDALDPLGLTEGFREGVRPVTEATQEAGRWIEDRARDLGEETRRGTENLLNGAGETLERLTPGGLPYAGRQVQYDQYGRPIPRTVEPPSAAAQAQRNSVDFRTPQPGTAGDRSPLYDDYNNPLQRGRADSPSAASGFDDRPFNTTEGQRGPQLNPNAGGSGGLVENFTDSRNEYGPEMRSRRLEPVRRTQGPSSPTYDDQQYQRRADSGFNPQRDYTTRREGVDSLASQDPPPFPEMPLARDNTTWGGGGSVRGQNPPSYDNTGGGVNPASTTGGDYDRPTNWASLNGGANDPAATAPDGTAATAAATAENPSNYFEKLLMVVSLAVAFFTWTAYLDVRNKYRAALRGAPSGYGSYAA